MPVLLLKLQDPDVSDEDLFAQCPYCDSTDVQRWGQSPKSVQDTQPVDIIVFRYNCKNCDRTFRYYPKGVDRSSYSQRIRRLAALIWVMELSIRDVVDVFEEFGITLNRMAVWREGQKFVDYLNTCNALDFSKRFSIDKSYGLHNRPRNRVVLALSLLPGKTVILGTLNSDNPAAVKSWLDPILENSDIRVASMGTKEFISTGEAD